MQNEVEQLTVYEIPVYNMPVFETKIAKLNKRGAKIGCDPIRITVVKTWDKILYDDYEGYDVVCRKVQTVIPMVSVTIEGKAPMLNGWTLVSVVEPVEGGVMLRKFPGTSLEIPLEFRDVTPDRCDHCHTSRQRNETFIVYHAVNGWKVVGRTCLADFTGIHNPERIANFASALYDLTISAVEGEGCSGGSSGGYTRAPMRSFLEMVALYTVRYGFVTGKKARESSAEGNYIEPTGRLVFHDHFLGPYSHYTGKAAQKFYESITDDESTKTNELMEKALEYGKTKFVEQDDATLNDFGHNMKLVLAADYVRHSDVGYIASIIPIYLRTLQKQVDYSKSRHISEVGCKITLPVTVVSVRPWEGQYGVTNITTMVDDEGNILTWFAPMGQVKKVGEYKVLTCKVKRHDERNGNKSTIISYPKFT